MSRRARITVEVLAEHKDLLEKAGFNLSHVMRAGLKLWMEHNKEAITLLLRANGET